MEDGDEAKPENPMATAFGRMLSGQRANACILLIVVDTLIKNRVISRDVVQSALESAIVGNGDQTMKQTIQWMVRMLDKCAAEMPAAPLLDEFLKGSKRPD